MKSSNDNRESIVCLVVDGHVHFCCHNLLSGINSNLRFPLIKSGEHGNELDFEEVERILEINRVASNIVDITFLRQNAQCREYEIRYNKHELNNFGEYVIPQLCRN